VEKKREGFVLVHELGGKHRAHIVSSERQWLHEHRRQLQQERSGSGPVGAGATPASTLTPMPVRPTPVRPPPWAQQQSPLEKMAAQATAILHTIASVHAQGQARARPQSSPRSRRRAPSSWARG